MRHSHRHGAAILLRRLRQVVAKIAHEEADVLGRAAVTVLLWSRVPVPLRDLRREPRPGIQMAAKSAFDVRRHTQPTPDGATGASGFYLSTSSLAMGLMWSLVDVDALCWHDRSAGSYLTSRE